MPTSDHPYGAPTPTHLPRRTLVAAGAWTVPVVAAATAAPAYAASPCQKTHNYKLQWRTANYTHDQANETSTSLTTGGGFTTVAPLTVGGATIFVVLQSAAQGTTTFDSNRNLSVPGATAGTDANRDPGITNLGGLNTTTGEDAADAAQRGLRLQNWRSGPTSRTTASTRTHRQTLNVSFRTGSRTGDLRMVKNLSFWITDIDSLSGTGSGTNQDPYANTDTRYYDRVELSPAGQFTTPVLDGISGSGTVASPWRNSNSNNNNGENNTGARVKVQFASDISSFTIDYWNAVGGAQYHRIFLSNLKFDVYGC